MAEILRYVNTASSAGGNGTTNSTTVGDANRAYASSQECESAQNADLTDAGGDTFRAVCEGSAEDTAGLTINGWVTSATCYITWEAISSAGRHDGTIGGVTNGYKLTRSDDRALGLASTGQLDLKLRGFVIRSQSNFFGISDVGIGNASGRVEIESMIVYSSTSGSTGRGINIAAGTVWVWNCFIYGYDGASVGYGLSSAGATIVAENITIRRCRFPFVVLSGSMTCYNCIASGGSAGGYTGASGGSHNVSYTTDAPGTNNTNSSTPTYAGTDLCATTSGDTIAKDTGTDRSAGTIGFTTDIAGNSRPQNSTWDRGCYELVVAGGGSIVPSNPSARVRRHLMKFF